MKRLALILGMAAAVMPASAEWTKDIDFESGEGYKSLSMYDCWEKSPFRTGALSLTPLVVANPDRDENEIIAAVPNPSETVAGAQRSRFGSNRFGLRIDLTEENYFELTPTAKYVHVKLLKPVEGRVMLVGLGSRDDVADQDPYVEQFWEVSQNPNTAGTWNDMVFTVKGAGGITMRSLVLVPDLESPHNYDSDFLFYIDDIKVNSNARPEFIYEYYGTSIDKTTAVLKRGDRYSTNVKMNSPKYGEQQIDITQQSDKKAYHNKTSEMPFVVECGETVTPSIGYAGNWMNAYFYIDLNRNGRFDMPEGEDGELIGSTSGNNWSLPSFTVPADLTPGLYRVRFKIDWDNTAPEGAPGDADTDNSLLKNGGVIVDAMLNVVARGAKASVNDFQLNGEILAGDGSKLTNYEVPAFQDLKVVIAPEHGFENNGFTLKCGYGVIDQEGEDNRYDKFGNPNWFFVDFPLSSFHKGETMKVIPGKYIFGNVLLQGRMAEEGTVNMYGINFDKDQTISRTDRHLDDVTFTREGGPAQKISVTDNVNPRYVYVEKLENPIMVKIGKSVNTSISYTGNAMHSYIYVDYDDNGFFFTDLGDDGLPTDASEVVAFSYFNGKDSKGKAYSKAGDAKPELIPDFVIPSRLQPGKYRARLKIDWNEINPAAREASVDNNKIWENGGAVLDFIFDAVDHIPATELSINKTDIALDAGNSETITATLAPIDADDVVVWTSSDETVARVNDKGEVTGRSEGTAVITATVGEHKAECNVAVTGTIEEDGISEINADGVAKIYDLMGRRVVNPASGQIMIVNGKVTKL